MIAQILNRQFVLEQLDAVERELGKPPDDRRGAAGESPADVSEEDCGVAAQEIAAARQREEKISSGQHGFDDDSDARRGQEAAPIDDTVFISHDPMISLLQSALTQYFEERKAGEIDPEPPSDEPRRNDGFVAVSARKIASVEVRERDAEGRRLFNAYSETDPRWVASLVAMGVRKFRTPHPFNPKPADPVKIANNARLILVGDWGSGLPRACKVSDRMREVLNQGAAAGIEQHVIHLGDVYYSGWQREYEKNFLPHWPVKEGEHDKFGSWCLNGNHDMYAGGYGYFDYLLADRRFARQQQSSFFSLHNDHWDILGLDTAWEDEGLQDPQASWIEKTLKDSPRKSMLMSHHQLFSAYEKACEPLAIKISPILAQHPVDAWFWGHEHRCVLYREHQNVRNARLIGNGGVPVYMTHKDDGQYPRPAFYEYRKFIRGFLGLEKWAYFGFTVVDFDGGTAKVRYFDETEKAPDQAAKVPFKEEVLS